MSGRALATAVTWLLLALSAGAHGQDRLDAVDAYLEAAFAGSSLPGMAVAVVSGGDVAYARGFGVADRESRAAVTVDTAFELGSLTKSMTALAVLRLAEAGRVDLDAPVRRYLPWFRVADADASAAITPRHLLGHTSGLPRWSHGVVWRDPERVSGSVAEGVRALASVPLAFAPGEAVSYANMGYAVLGAVIEAVTGAPWDAFLAAELLAPLGMERTGLTVAGRSSLSVATPHAWRLGAQVPAGAPAPFVGPAGSTPVSSARDMAAYLAAWLEPGPGGVVTPWAYERATEPQGEYGRGEAYGLGWVLGSHAGERLMHHTGGTEGSASFMALLPERGLGVVVLANGESSLPPRIGRGVLDALLGRVPPPVGPDETRGLSVALTVVSGACAALLALLVARVARGARGPRRQPRGRVLWLRALALVALAAGAWAWVPAQLRSMGMPVPFGVRGYPLDFALAAAGLLLTTTAWAAHGLVALARGTAAAAGRAARPERSGIVDAPRAAAVDLRLRLKPADGGAPRWRNR